MLQVLTVLFKYSIELTLTDQYLKSLCDSLEKCDAYPSLSFVLTPVTVPRGSLTVDIKKGAFLYL